MQNSNLYFTLFQKISEHLTILLNIQPKKKAGRPPKVSDLQLAALYITSYVSNTPILTLARFLIYPSIQSWHRACCKINFSVKIKYTKSKNGMFI
jgi:hypothetical protein